MSYCISHYHRPVYLCGEMDRSDHTRVVVPIVCSQNWDEFIRSSPDHGTAVQLRVKKAAIIKSNPLGMLASIKVFF